MREWKLWEGDQLVIGLIGSWIKKREKIKKRGVGLTKVWESVESTNKDLIQFPRFAFGNYEHVEMKAEAMGFSEMIL